MIALFYACVRTCSTALIMEHPGKPKAVHSPSSWKLPELMCIEQHDLGDAVHISQCAFQAPSQKPTTLLTFNMPQLRHVVSTRCKGGRCTHTEHEVVLKGIDEQGNFRTSPAKQYPSELNKCLALASSEFICDHFTPSHDLDYDTFAGSVVA